MKVQNIYRLKPGIPLIEFPLFDVGSLLRKPLSMSLCPLFCTALVQVTNEKNESTLWRDWWTINAWKLTGCSSQFWCLCAIQSQYLRWHLWEDGAEEDPEGSVEDRPEQPGEDHRPASEQRQPGQYDPNHHNCMSHPNPNPKLHKVWLLKSTPLI